MNKYREFRIGDRVVITNPNFIAFGEKGKIIEGGSSCVVKLNKGGEIMIAESGLKLDNHIPSWDEETPL